MDISIRKVLLIGFLLALAYLIPLSISTQAHSVAPPPKTTADDYTIYYTLQPTPGDQEIFLPYQPNNVWVYPAPR